MSKIEESDSSKMNIPIMNYFGGVYMHDVEFIGFEIKKIDNLFKKRIANLAKKRGIEDITMMHSLIVHYLYENKGREVYQKDVEKVLHANRSTITNLMKDLEKREYIIRKSVPSDARLKKLELTEKGEQLHQIFADAIAETEQNMESALTIEEKAQFIQLSRKIENQLEFMK